MSTRERPIQTRLNNECEINDGVRKRKKNSKKIHQHSLILHIFQSSFTFCCSFAVIVAVNFIEKLEFENFRWTSSMWVPMHRSRLLKKGPKLLFPISDVSAFLICTFRNMVTVTYVQHEELRKNWSICWLSKVWECVVLICTHLFHNS